MSFYLWRKLRNCNGFNCFRNIAQFATIVCLENIPSGRVFHSCTPLFSDERIIIVGSDLRSKFGYLWVFELIAVGATSEAEVGASNCHIHTRRTIILDQISKPLAKLHPVSTTPSLVSPVGDPPAVYLPPEEETVIGPEMRCLDHLVFLVSFTPTDTDMGARPVMHLPFLIRLLIVKLTVYSQILPHVPQVGHVLWRFDVVTELVLDLDHNYRPSLLVEVRIDHLRQRSEIFFHLSLIELVRLTHSQTLYSKQPGRQPPEIPLRTDIRPRPQQYLHLVLYRQFDKTHQIPSICAEIEPPISELVMVPHDVNTKRVEPHPLDHSYAVLPVLPRDARIVDFSGVDRQECLELLRRDRSLYFSQIGVPRTGEDDERQEDHH